MKKRTNSVISSLYHPIGPSRLRTAACMFAGGLILVCLGVGLIVTTLSVRRHPRPPSTASSHVDETSVLISGPTCLALGLVVAVMSGADMCRHRRARRSVESELSRAVMGVSGKEGTRPEISIVVNKSVWPPTS